MWLWCTFWCVLPWVQLLWDALSFLDFLEVYFFCQIREGLLHYVFKSVFNYLLFLFSFWLPSDVGTIKVVPEVPKPLLIFLNSCFFILFWLNVYSSVADCWFESRFPSLPLSLKINNKIFLKNKQSKQLEQKQMHRNGDHMEGYQWRSGRRRGKKVQRISSINGR